MNAQHRAIVRSAVALVFVATLAGAAQAGIVFTEDFNAGVTAGSPLTPDKFSERWANTDYFAIGSVAGWTFSGTTPILAVNLDDTTNKALLLNEPSAVATRTLTGLDPSVVYTLTFNLSGDNRPNLAYVFLLDINSVNVLSVTDSWSLPTGGAGSLQSVSFTPDGSGNAQLKFYQASATSSSPIVDDIVVSVPDGGATLALLGCALFGLGVLRRTLGR